jgi:hypothetical protein
MLTTLEIIVFVIIIFLTIFLLYINKKKMFNKFENNEKTQPIDNNELNESGFYKNELKPSYWYNYAASEIRSKCFACDANSNYRHPSNCIDCEMKGGRPVDKLLNRVLTR